MKIKKYLAFVIAVVLLLPALTACGGGGEVGENSAEPQKNLDFVFSVAFGKNVFTAEYINTPGIPDGAVAVYTRDYRTDGAYTLSVENSGGRTLITVNLIRKGENDEFSVIAKTSDQVAAEIPVNGFVLSVPDAALENVRCGEGSLATVTGYDNAVDSYEEHSYATFSVNDKGAVSTRRINIVDPLSPTRSGKIYLITEDYEKAAQFPEGSIAVSLKKITSHSYEISDIAPAVEETAPAKGEAILIFSGEYNNAYADYYFKKGVKIMLNSPEKANGYSDLPSLVINGQAIEFDKDNSNISEVSSEGVYYYDVGFSSRVTPVINGLKRRDIVIVEGYVAAVASENDCTLIPDGNGFVMTLVGDEYINKYSELKEGDISDTFYIDFVPIAEKYVKINDIYIALDKIDALRQPEGVCVLYTRDFGATTGTNKYGVEVIISDNKVIAVEANKGDAEIPESGYVLSVHKDHPAYKQLLTVTEGDEAALRLSPDYAVSLLGYDGINSVRHEDQLIVYKDNKYTGTNVYGYEIIVNADGIVTGDSTSGNSYIPEGGFVLSGHGKSADALKELYVLGETAAYDTKSKKVIIVRTPAIKITAAEDAYKKALASLENSKKNYVNIDYVSAQDKLENAKSLVESAEDCVKNYDFINAASKADEATLALKYFDYELIPSHSVENRAMWYRSSEKSDDEVRAVLEKVKSLNVNAIYLETWYDGKFIGFTDVEDVDRPSVNGDYDALEGFVRIGHELGIEIHAWVENFFVGYTSGDSYTSSMARRFAEKLLIDKKGRNYFYYHENASFVFMNPYDRECRDTIKAVYRSIVENYDIDGLHLDYIRFPELNYIDGVSDFGYNEDIIAGFAAETGITADPHYFDKGTKEKTAWIEFRCSIISSFVKEVRDELLAIDPELWISAATYPDVRSAHDNIFQDMATWAKNGWVDELFSMTYSADNAYVRDDARSYAEFCEGNCFYSTGLAAFSETDQMNFAHQLTEVRECGADGVAVFSLANIYPYTYQYEIQKGAFRAPSVQSYYGYEAVVAGLNEMSAKLTNLKDIYTKITPENSEDIKSVIAGIIHDASEFGNTAEPSVAQRINYCNSAAGQLERLKDEIIKIAGDNAETRSLCADADSLIYVLELTAKRLSAR